MEDNWIKDMFEGEPEPMKGLFYYVGEVKVTDLECLHCNYTTQIPVKIIDGKFKEYVTCKNCGWVSLIKINLNG